MRRGFKIGVLVGAVALLVTAALTQRDDNDHVRAQPRGRRADLPVGVRADFDVAYRSDTEPPYNLLDISYHEESAPGGRPAIIFVHGGGWRGGDKSTYAQRPAREYAGDGYVTVNVNYRLSGSAPFPAAIEDVKAAIRWLRANAERYGVDPSRIGMMGGSAGAHLVALAGVTSPDDGLEGDGPHPEVSSRVQCVVARSGIYDLRPEFLTQKGNGDPAVVGFLGGPADEKAELARQASPVVYLDAEDPPLLLIHGTEDWRIPILAAEHMVAALERAGTPYQYIRVEGGGHGGAPTPKRAAEIEAAIAAFFAKHLKQ
ncbi:MAG: alpha/beta hydrolase fold domain-containing protein [Armatimonadota bacterium]